MSRCRVHAQYRWLRNNQAKHTQKINAMFFAYLDQKSKDDAKWLPVCPSMRPNVVYLAIQIVWISIQIHWIKHWWGPDLFPVKPLHAEKMFVDLGDVFCIFSSSSSPSPSSSPQSQSSNIISHQFRINRRETCDSSVPMPYFVQGELEKIPVISARAIFKCMGIREPCRWKVVWPVIKSHWKHFMLHDFLVRTLYFLPLASTFCQIWWA